MAGKIEQGEETTLNMTPMIDICFQLIVFFMLTLHFKSVDKRIETQLPKDRGQGNYAASISPFQTIQVKLFRKNLDKPVDQQFTRIRVGESYTLELPPGQWKKDSDSEEARRLQEEPIWEKVTAQIAAMWAKQGKNPEVKGELKAPPPDGKFVSHGDMMHALDCFLAAGMKDVVFEGAAAPQLGREGGGWSFDK